MLNKDNGMQVFQNEEFGQVRSITKDGEPWFVAADVCRALEVGNSRQALVRLDDDEKGVIPIDTPGGEQQMSIVNEPGLYTLVLGSRKKEARSFKRWITHEVIPAIRKTGSYKVNQAANQNRPLSIDKEIRAQAMLINAQTRQFTAITKGIRDNKLTLRIAAVVYGIKELAYVGAETGRGETSNGKALTSQANKTSWSATEVGQMYGVTANKVGRLAKKYNLKTEEHGFWTVGQCPHNLRPVDTYRYNRRGAERIGELLAKEEMAAA